MALSIFYVYQSLNYMCSVLTIQCRKTTLKNMSTICKHEINPCVLFIFGLDDRCLHLV